MFIPNRIAMGASMRTGVLLALAMLALAVGADAAESRTEGYSQKDLLKNWAFSACLAAVAKDPADRDDANATASAYMEFGHQGTEAYDQLRALAERYATRKYGGSVPSDFNTMKCIDLFHSSELENLARKLARAH